MTLVPGAIVSPVAGTTTDPVQKAIEINGLGAAVIVDTPGLDDFTELGGERMARTAKVLDKTDIAVVLFTDEGGDAEYRIIEECRVREIPTLVVLNQIDRLESKDAVVDEIRRRSKLQVLGVSASTGEGVDELRAAIVACRTEEERYITEGFCKAGDRVLLVMPQDKAAPKGRLIQPQVQTIRDLLDGSCVVVSATADRMDDALATLKNPPALIITDSQVFAQVEKLKPEHTRLSSQNIHLLPCKPQ